MNQSFIKTEETLIVETPERVPLEFALASIGNRFLAVMIDHFIQYLTIFVVGCIFWSISGIGGTWKSSYTFFQEMPKWTQNAEEEFNRRFVKKEIPDEIEEIKIASQIYKLADLLVRTNLAVSKGEARRLVEQGGVKINGEKASNTNAHVDITSKQTILVQVGKRNFRRIRGI